MHEWESEPDSVEWTCKGMPCRVERASLTGALCGYVGLHRRHAFYGMDPERLDHWGVECHGGVTYACKEGRLWWVGFDCSHAGDYMPRIGELAKTILDGWPWYSCTALYKPIGWVREETERLARQLWRERHGRRQLRKMLARRDRECRKALVRLAGMANARLRAQWDPWVKHDAPTLGVRTPRSLRSGLRELTRITEEIGGYDKEFRRCKS